MKKIIAISILLSTLALLSTSCIKERIVPSGRIENEYYDFQDIKGICVSSAIKLELVQDPVEGLSIDADDNLFPFLNVEKRNGIIHVEFKNCLWVVGNHRVTVTLYYKDLEYVELSGASRGKTINDAIDLAQFKVVLSGASKFEGTVFSEEFHANLSGASSLDISGECDYYRLYSSGSSKTNGYNFTCKDLRAHISGSGTSKHTITNSINANLSGASKLYYDGTPSFEDIDLSGSSKILRR